MKSIIVKELKKLGYKRINGVKLEQYGFYVLVGFWTRIKNGEEIK